MDGCAAKNTTGSSQSELEDLRKRRLLYFRQPAGQESSPSSKRHPPRDITSRTVNEAGSRSPSRGKTDKSRTLLLNNNNNKNNVCPSPKNTKNSPRSDGFAQVKEGLFHHDNDKLKQYKRKLFTGKHHQGEVQRSQHTNNRSDFPVNNFDLKDNVAKETILRTPEKQRPRQVKNGWESDRQDKDSVDIRVSKVDVKAKPLFQRDTLSAEDLEELGLHTHRVEEKEKGSDNSDSLLRDQHAFEGLDYDGLRNVLGADKFNEFIEKSLKDLSSLHSNDRKTAFEHLSPSKGSRKSNSAGVKHSPTKQDGATGSVCQYNDTHTNSSLSPAKQFKVLESQQSAIQSDLNELGLSTHRPVNPITQKRPSGVDSKSIITLDNMAPHVPAATRTAFTSQDIYKQAEQKRHIHSQDVNFFESPLRLDMEIFGPPKYNSLYSANPGPDDKAENVSPGRKAVGRQRTVSAPETPRLQHVQAIRKYHEHKRQLSTEMFPRGLSPAFSNSSLDRYFSSLQDVSRDNASVFSSENFEPIPEPVLEDSDPEHSNNVSGVSHEEWVAQERRSPDSSGDIMKRHLKMLGIDLDFLTDLNKSDDVSGNLPREQVRTSLDDPLADAKEHMPRNDPPQQQLTKPKLVVICPECDGVNNSRITWCMECGCVLIGVDPVPVKSKKNYNPPKPQHPLLSSDLEDETQRFKCDNTSDTNHRVFELSETVKSRKDNIAPKIQHSFVSTDLWKATRQPDTIIYPPDSRSRGKPNYAHTEDLSSVHPRNVSTSPKVRNPLSSAELLEGTPQPDTRSFPPDSKPRSKPCFVLGDNPVLVKPRNDSIPPKAQHPVLSAGLLENAPQRIAFTKSDVKPRSEAHLSQRDPLLTNFTTNAPEHNIADITNMVDDKPRMGRIPSEVPRPIVSANPLEAEIPNVTPQGRTNSDLLLNNSTTKYPEHDTSDGSGKGGIVRPKLQSDLTNKTDRLVKQDLSLDISASDHEVDDVGVNSSSFVNGQYEPRAMDSVSSDEESVQETIHGVSRGTSTYNQQKNPLVPSLDLNLSNTSSAIQSEQRKMFTDASADVAASVSYVEEPSVSQQRSVKNESSRKLKTPSSKGKRASTSSKVKQSIEAEPYQRHWQRSSIAWSSYNSRELNTRSSIELGQRNKKVKKGTHRGSFGGETPVGLRDELQASSPQRAFRTELSSASNSSGSGARPKNKSRSSQSKVPSLTDPPGDQPDQLRGGPSKFTSRALTSRALDTYRKYNEMSPRVLAGEVSIWQCLPDELLLHIFHFLSLHDIVQCARVCNQFHRVALDTSNWCKITLVKKGLCDECLAEIGQRRPVKLSLIKCRGEQYNGECVTNKGLRELFVQCSDRLTSLNVSGCCQGQLTGDSILLHASMHCKNITDLDVSWSAISDAGVAAVCESTNRLESLTLNGCQGVTDSTIAVVADAHGRSLIHLGLFGCFNITPRGIQALSSRCSYLRSLSLGQCYKLTDASIFEFSKNLSFLEYLDLRGCKQVKDNCVRKIARHCRKLESLILANCIHVTDSSLKDVAIHLPCIRLLDVSGCKHVSDSGVQALTNACVNLRDIDLSSTGITHKSINMLASYANRCLESVKVSFCKDITEGSLVKLAKHCRRLRALHIYGCKGLKSLSRIKAENSALEIDFDGQT